MTVRVRVYGIYGGIVVKVCGSNGCTDHWVFGEDAAVIRQLVRERCEWRFPFYRCPDSITVQIRG